MGIPISPQVHGLAAGFKGLGSYPLMDIADALRSAEMAIPFHSALTEPEVLEAIVADPELSTRFASALRPTLLQMISREEEAAKRNEKPRRRPRPIDQESAKKLATLREIALFLAPLTPQPLSSPDSFVPVVKPPDGSFYWSDDVRTHFLFVSNSPWKRGRLTDLWREVRDLLPLGQRDLSKAAAVWATVLERNGIGRQMGKTEEFRHAAQVLRSLGVKAIPEGRSHREVDPSSIGFSSLTRDYLAETPPGLRPGDLVTYGDPIFASAAILTKATPEGLPAEVMMLVGGHILLAHPRLPGDRPFFWRLTTPPPEYLLLSQTSYPHDHSVDRVLYLDEFLEVEEAIDFPGTGFQAVEKNSWGTISSDEWLVETRFADASFAFFHLTIQRSEKGRRLSVVIDFWDEEEAARPEFVTIAEEGLVAVARRLGFEELVLSYKMIVPHESPDFARRVESGGYRKVESGGWGRLPGRRIKLTLRSRRQ